MLELPLLLRFTGVLDLDLELDLLLLLSRWFPPLDLRRWSEALRRFPWEFRSCVPRLPLEDDNDDDDAAAVEAAEDGRFILGVAHERMEELRYPGRTQDDDGRRRVKLVRVVAAAKVPVQPSEYR